MTLLQSSGDVLERMLPGESANVKGKNPAKNDLVQPWQSASESNSTARV